MSKKYADLLKNAAISVIIGTVPALITLVLCNLFMKSHRLSFFEQIIMYKIRIAMPLMIRITVILFMMVFFIGRRERREEKAWKQEDLKRAHGSGVTGVNEFGLIDDSREKGFLSIYGEEIKPGSDHGTAYMIFKFLSVLSFFITVLSVMVMLFMMLLVKG